MGEMSWSTASMASLISGMVLARMGVVRAAKKKMFAKIFMVFWNLLNN